MKSVVTFLAIILGTLSLQAQDLETAQPQVNQPSVTAPIVTTMPVQATPVAPTVTTTNYLIRQIIKSHHLVVVEMQGTQINWPAGKIFLVNFNDGKQCTLLVKETSASYVTFDSSQCELEGSISTKNTIEPALVGVAASSTPNVTPPKTEAIGEPTREVYARMGLNIYYATADEIEFNSAYVSTTTGSGNISSKFKTDGALGIGLSLTRMTPQSFGFTLGAAVELGREIKSFSVTGPGGSYTAVGTGTLPKLNILYVEYQGVYRWEQFYLPFGFNISSPYLYDYVGTSIEAKGGFGFVVGGGFLLNENSAIEILHRSIGFYLKESDSSGYVDFRYGTLAGTTVGFKYLF